MDFTNKRIDKRTIHLNGETVPYADTAKYLGMTLDAKLRWKPHVKKKKEEIQLKYRKMYWLLGRHSALSIQNKTLLYRQVLAPIWTYGIQLWGCAKQSTRNIIQRAQNKILRGIANAPWYIRNANLHKDLGVDFVDTILKKQAQSHHQRLQSHVNVEARQLLEDIHMAKRLKRKRPFDLI